jgi:hypothetical protein
MPNFKLLPICSTWCLLLWCNLMVFDGNYSMFPTVPNIPTSVVFPKYELNPH